MDTVIESSKPADTRHSGIPSRLRKSLISRFLALFNKEERSIRKGMKEAEMIQSGKLKAKSFDTFLNEI